MAGVVSAIFNSAAQLGSAIGVAIVESITVNVDEAHASRNESWTDKYSGSAAAFELYIGLTAVTALAFLIFAKNLDGTEGWKEELESEGSQEEKV